MRKLITTIATAAVFSLSAINLSMAAPAAPEFAPAYDATFAICLAGDVEGCRTNLQALIQAYIDGGVSETAALTSFTAMRADLVAAGAPQPIIDLFEELLPDSGAVGAPVSPV